MPEQPTPAGDGGAAPLRPRLRLAAAVLLFLIAGPGAGASVAFAEDSVTSTSEVSSTELQNNEGQNDIRYEAVSATPTATFSPEPDNSPPADAPTECTLELSPQESTGPIGEEHTVIAEVTDNRVDGSVTFVVRSGERVVDRSEPMPINADHDRAEFTYGSQEARFDSIRATFTGDDGETSCSDEAAREWTEPESTCTVELTSEQSTPVGEQHLVEALVTEGPRDGAVSFTVRSGEVEHEDSGPQRVNADGYASFSYSAEEPRTERVTATFVGNDEAETTCSDSAPHEWTAPPVDAADDRASTPRNSPVSIDVLANDTFPEGDEVLSIEPGGEPANGTAEVVGDRIVYTPREGYSGADRFVYRLSTSNERQTEGDSDTAVVSVNVTLVRTTAQIVNAEGPLTRIRTSDDLNCAVNHIADSDGEFYNDTACGTFLVVGGTLYGPQNIPAGGSASPRTAWMPVSQEGGAGTDSPNRIVTVVEARGAGIRLTQTDTYEPGEELYTTSVTIRALPTRGERQVARADGSPSQSIRLYRAGDCYLNGSDAGFGRAQDGAVACVGSDDGEAPNTRIQEFRDLSGGSRYYQARYYEVWSAIGDQEPFPNTCRCEEFIDNGAGLSWDSVLAPGGSVTHTHQLTFSPDESARPAITKAADRSSSAPGTTNGYTITVSNPTSREVAVTAVRDQLPEGFSYVDGSTSGDTTDEPRTGEAGSLQWDRPFTVAAGDTATLRFDVRVSSTPGSYLNTAEAEFARYPLVTTGPTAPIRVTEAASPTPSPSPTMTPSPSPSPSMTPSPTPTMTMSPTPTPTMSPTPEPTTTTPPPSPPADPPTPPDPVFPPFPQTEPSVPEPAPGPPAFPDPPIVTDPGPPDPPVADPPTDPVESDVEIGGTVTEPATGGGLPPLPPSGTPLLPPGGTPVDPLMPSPPVEKPAVPAPVPDIGTSEPETTEPEEPAALGPEEPAPTQPEDEDVVEVEDVDVVSSLALDRPSSLPGGFARVSGTGCPAGSDVLLSFAGRSVGRTTAGPDGSFSASLDLPQLPIGSYDVRARCGDLVQTVPLSLVVAASVGGVGAAAAAAGSVVLAFFLLIGFVFTLNNSTAPVTALPIRGDGADDLDDEDG